MSDTTKDKQLKKMADSFSELLVIHRNMIGETRDKELEEAEDIRAEGVKLVKEAHLASTKKARADFDKLDQNVSRIENSSGMDKIKEIIED